MLDNAPALADLFDEAIVEELLASLHSYRLRAKGPIIILRSGGSLARRGLRLSGGRLSGRASRLAAALQLHDDTWPDLLE